MGGSVEYRVYLDGKPADETFYKMLETVTVEQSMDMATEARLEIELCADEHGYWSPIGGELKAWDRVRIEVKNMTDDWVALIDGPITTWVPTMSAEPGQSMTTMIVNDDTSLLNTEEKERKFEGRTDEQVVKELLASIDTTPTIDPFPARPKDVPLKVHCLCTQMQLLLQLTRPFGRHVYVRPGARVGTSAAFVKKFCPASTVKLPSLVLAGAGRNVESFDMRISGAGAPKVIGGRLQVDDIRTKFVEAKQDDVERLGDENPFADAVSQPSKVVTLTPAELQFLDPDALAKERAEQLSFTLQVRGSVRAGTYPGVLQLYERVTISGVPQPFNTTWMIRDVTHTLGRSEYRQDFTLIGNGVASDVRKNIPPPEIRTS